jgi:hypothetical protein
MFKSLNSVVDSLQNYKNYREQLRRSVMPCLPYFGIFLRDLTFTDVGESCFCSILLSPYLFLIGNPGKIGDNINFEKIYMTSRILKEIQTFQRTPYSFEEDEMLQPLLRRLLGMLTPLFYSRPLFSLLFGHSADKKLQQCQKKCCISIRRRLNPASSMFRVSPSSPKNKNKK